MRLYTRDDVRRHFDEHGVRLAKYLTGSIIAMLVSTATFMGTFGPGLLGSKGASLTASATGAIVNYFLNRNWTWGQRGRGNFQREVVPYWTTVIITAIAAALVTDVVNAITRSITHDRPIRTVVNTAAFLATYGVSFLLKYRIFNRLFSGHGHAPETAEPEALEERMEQPAAT